MFQRISNDLGLLVLRLASGLMMIYPHGYMKLNNFSALSTKFPDPIGVGSQFSLILATFAEIFCALMIILGIKTRFFAIPLFITMIVATFIVHGNDPWKMQEKAFLFAMTYLVLMLTGGGKYSVRD